MPCNPQDSRIYPAGVSRGARVTMRNTLSQIISPSQGASMTGNAFCCQDLPKAVARVVPGCGPKMVGGGGAWLRLAQVVWPRARGLRGGGGPSWAPCPVFASPPRKRLAPQAGEVAAQAAEPRRSPPVAVSRPFGFRDLLVPAGSSSAEHRMGMCMPASQEVRHETFAAAHLGPPQQAA